MSTIYQSKRRRRAALIFSASPFKRLESQPRATQYFTGFLHCSNIIASPTMPSYKLCFIAVVILSVVVAAALATEEAEEEQVPLE